MDFVSSWSGCKRMALDPRADRYINGSQLRVILPIKGHLAMSRMSWFLVSGLLFVFPLLIEGAPSI